MNVRTMLSFPVASRSSALTILAGTILLTGCALGTAVFPDTEPASTQVIAGAVQGNNYGGHAPLVGAHVFVLQAGTGGYGSKASSLLTSVGTTHDFYGNVFTPALDTTAGSPTNGMYYITTSNIGTFALSGDYTCTAGDPVYLYASGGNPQTIPSVKVTQINSYTDSNNKTVVVFTTPGTNLIYQGEPVNFTTFTTGTSYDAFSGAQNQTVSPFYLTTNTVGFELGGNITSSLPQGVAVSATISQATPIISNPAVVNIALLGNCPGSVTFAGIPDGTSTSTMTGVSPADMANLAVGNMVTGPGINVATITALSPSTGTITFNQTDTGGNPAGPYYTYASTSSAAKNFSSLNFVYMNEVSTVAAMTALAPFASVTSTTNDALHIGTSSTNLAGLQHAVVNANNLYDIQGSNAGTGGDGETHIARPTTPTNSGGTVPQTLIDTLGDMLASCVDSANTYNAATASSGTQTAQCAALFTNATSDGTTSGTQPNDTATAMLNIAHHPAGEGNATFMSGTFGAITGNSPFQPMLSSAPNDWSVGISYTGNGLSSPGNLAFDASGDAWITSNGNVVELGPGGTPLSGTTGYATATGYQNRAPVIDSSGNFWFITTTGTGAGYVNKMSSLGALQSGAGYDTQTSIGPYSLAVDANNNIWVANGQSTQVADNYAAYVTELNQSGATVQTVNANPSSSATGGANVLLGPNGIMMDGNGLMWIDGGASGTVASINTSSGTVTWYANTSSTASNDPSFLALDQNNKLWIPNLNTNFVQTVTPSAATNVGTNEYSYSYPTYTGGGLNSSTGPSAAAVDGANNIWVMGNGQKYVSEFSNAGVALTPAGGYAGGFGSTGGNRLAIDGSGDVWMPIGGANSVIEMIGVATPVVTPMVTAAKTGTPAARP